MEVLQGVLEASPDAVLVVDDEGIVRRANRNVADVLGYAADDVEGMAVEEFLAAEDRERHVDFRQEYIESPEPRPMGRDLELYAVDADDADVPVEISLGPIEHDGESYVVATITDVTHRKRRIEELEASEERYRRLLAVSPAPIVIYDDSGTVVYANEAAVETMAVDSADALIGTPVVELVHPDERSDARENVHRALADEVRIDRVERALVTPDGETRHAIVSATPIHYEDEPAVQVVVNDVTELKERERMLRRQNERLDEFASIVSHDLRNPLNVARGHVELAREECDSDHLDAVVRAHERMETLVDDLLTLAREGRSVADVESVPLGRVAEDCWRTVDTAAATLAVETERTVRADKGRLEELLSNLFRNAVEHGGADVTVTVGDCEGGFYVADDGPGIDGDVRGRAFERGVSTNDGGTGFGLAIVERIATAHDWEVRVVDGVGDGGGARFEVLGVE